MADQEEQMQKLVEKDQKLTDEAKLTKQTVKDGEATIDHDRKKIERLRNAPAASDLKLRTFTDERTMLEEEAKQIEPALDEVRARALAMCAHIMCRDVCVSKPRRVHCNSNTPA